MPRGDWFGYATFTIAVAVFLAVVGIFSSVIIKEYAEVHQANAVYQQNAERDRQIAAGEVADLCGNREGEALRVCILQRLETYYRDQVTNEDLQAQQDMAFWAKALFISSTALTIIGLILLGLTLQATRATLDEAGRTTKAAQATVDETKRIGEAQVRAYINISDVKANIDGTTVRFRFDVNNSGQSPARAVTINVKGGMGIGDRNLLNPTYRAATYKWITDIRPGDKIDSYLGDGGFGNITPEVIEKIKKSPWGLHVMVSISFKDVFQIGLIEEFHYWALYPPHSDIYSERRMDPFPAPREEEQPK